MGNGAPRRSSSAAVREKLWAKVPAGHLPVSRLLDRIPPLRRNSALPVQPVPDQCLAGISATTEGPHLVGEGLLAAGNPYGALEGSNMGLFHGAAAYTTTVVKSNTPGCMTNNNTGCSVSDVADFRARKGSRVANTAKKLKDGAKPKAEAIKDANGKTLGMRLQEAINYHEGALKRKYTAQDLFRDVNRLLGTPEESPAITQQSISKILVADSTVSTSKNCVYFAKVLGVDCLWLSSGIGDKIPK